MVKAEELTQSRLHQGFISQGRKDAKVLDECSAHEMKVICPKDGNRGGPFELSLGGSVAGATPLTLFVSRIALDANRPGYTVPKMYI